MKEFSALIIVATATDVIDPFSGFRDSNIFLKILDCYLVPLVVQPIPFEVFLAEFSRVVIS